MAVGALLPTSVDQNLCWREGGETAHKKAAYELEKQIVGPPPLSLLTIPIVKRSIRSRLVHEYACVRPSEPDVPCNQTSAPAQCVEVGRAETELQDFVHDESWQRRSYRCLQRVLTLDLTEAAASQFDVVSHSRGREAKINVGLVNG